MRPQPFIALSDVEARATFDLSVVPARRSLMTAD